MTDLALIDQSHSVDVERWAQTLVFARQLAEVVSATEFVPGALRDRPDAVAASIMYGAEVGLTPMQALAGIHIVDGRPSPSAELMRAMIYRAGHTLTVHESSGTRARISGLRAGRPESERVIVEWTLDMARSAGLLGRGAWQRYPRSMLIARASGDLARLLFADVIKGLGYVAEDDSAEIVESWQQSGVEPDSPVARRRTPLQRRQKASRPPMIEEHALPDPTSQIEDLARPPVAPDTPEPEHTRRADPVEKAPPIPADADDDEREAIEQERISGPAPTYADDDVPLPDEIASVVLPELRPETTQDEPPAREAGPILIAARPLAALHTGLSRELGSAASREEKHAMLRAILNRDISSSKELTRAEGYRALDYMDRFANGDATWEFTDGGDSIVVYDTRQEPDG